MNPEQLKEKRFKIRLFLAVKLTAVEIQSLLRYLASEGVMIAEKHSMDIGIGKEYKTYNCYSLLEEE